MHFFFKNLILYSSCLDQTNLVYSDHDQGWVYQNCKKNYHRGGGLLRLDHISNIGENALQVILSKFCTLWFIDQTY